MASTLQTSRHQAFGARRAAAPLSFLVATLFVCMPALALKPVVVDGADMFKAETVRKADDAIERIKQQSGTDLMIETYATIPANMRADFEKKGKEQFYADWLRERARALGVNGIFILVTKNPGRLQVGVGNAAISHGVFTVQDREQLRAILTKAFRASDFDAGLTEAIDFVQKQVEHNTGGGGGVAQGGAPAVQPTPGAAPTSPPPRESTPPPSPATAPSGHAPATPATAPASPSDDGGRSDF